MTFAALLAVLSLITTAPAFAGIKVKAGSPGSALAPNIIFGYARSAATAAAPSSGHALLTANIAGVKVGNFPVFFGGVGVDLRALDSAFGDFTGVGMSVPLVTCYYKNFVG